MTLEEHDLAFINKEICKLYAVLVLFNITYLIRGTYDFIAKGDLPDLTLRYLFFSMTLGLLWDFAPVMLLMIYHYRNFKVKQQDQVDFALTPDETHEQNCSVYTKTRLSIMTTQKDED